MKYILLFILILQNVLFGQKITDYGFKLVKTIKLTNEIIIANIDELDYDSKNRILITDIISKKVFLFNFDGNLIREINPGNCNPGFNWRPRKAIYTKYNEIFVLNGNPWGYRFKTTGECLSPMSNKYIGSFNVSSTKENLVGYYTEKMDQSLKILTKDGLIKKSFNYFEKKDKLIVDRLSYGGCCSDENDNLYQVTALSYKIKKIDKYGKLVSEFGVKPKFYRSFPFIKINNQNDIGEFMSKMKELFIGGYYFTQDIFEFNKDKLFVLYFAVFKINGKLSAKNGFQIYSTQGKLLKEGVIDSYEQKIIAKNNKIIIVQPQEMNFQNNSLSNSNIEIYEY